MEMPASHLAILWRCNAQGSGVCKSGTLGEDDLAREVADRLAKMAKEC